MIRLIVLVLGLRSPPNHKRRSNEEVDEGNEKADGKDSEENYDDITMECHFVLNYAGPDEEQLVTVIMSSEKECKDLCNDTDEKKNFKDFQNGKHL